jgi:hypothetical protein
MVALRGRVRAVEDAHLPDAGIEHVDLGNRALMRTPSGESDMPWLGAARAQGLPKLWALKSLPVVRSPTEKPRNALHMM